MRNETGNGKPVPLLPYFPYIEAFGNREVPFRFRGRSYRFSLSPGLFSSAGIDTGSGLLLKVFSAFLDECFGPQSRAGLSGGAAPCSALDAGSGVGVLGVCAAGALADLALPGGSTTGRVFRVRAQDRDELARIFTEYNALKNGLPPEAVTAFTEPLLAGPPGQRWDIILTNIPAKAGRPVLEDFINRSAALLSENGRVFLVAVNTLADFFRLRIKAAASLLKEEAGKGHTVFVYAAGQPGGSQLDGRPAPVPVIRDENFPGNYPFYSRIRGEYKMEGLSYRLETVHGAPDFDSPGGAVQAAAKLAVKINLAGTLSAAETGAARRALLVYDAGQGHFALWLARYLTAGDPEECRLVLSGRNILALAAAGAAPGLSAIEPSIVPAADILLDSGRIRAAGGTGEGFGLIAFFPETVPESDRREAQWEGFGRLAAPGGIVIAGMASAEAERFDRKKLPDFTRAGDIKRKGFRAMAYRKK
jgi:hypothetical protein